MTIKPRSVNLLYRYLLKRIKVLKTKLTQNKTTDIRTWFLLRKKRVSKKRNKRFLAGKKCVDSSSAEKSLHFLSLSSQIPTTSLMLVLTKVFQFSTRFIFFSLSLFLVCLENSHTHSTTTTITTTTTTATTILQAGRRPPQKSLPLQKRWPISERECVFVWDMENALV